jgi:hypothetical protein
VPFGYVYTGKTRIGFAQRHNLDGGAEIGLFPSANWPRPRTSDFSAAVVALVAEGLARTKEEVRTK